MLDTAFDQPEPGDLVVHGLAALDLADKRGTRPLAQNVARKQHHELVAPHDPARRIDHAQTIRIAIERDAQLGAGFLHMADEVGQVGRHRRIGMMIGETAIGIAVQCLDREAHSP